MLPINYHCQHSLLFFYEEMEYKYRELMAVTREAKRFNFYSQQHRGYVELITDLKN